MFSVSCRKKLQYVLPVRRKLQQLHPRKSNGKEIMSHWPLQTCLKPLCPTRWFEFKPCMVTLNCSVYVLIMALSRQQQGLIAVTCTSCTCADCSKVPEGTSPEPSLASALPRHPTPSCAQLEPEWPCASQQQLLLQLPWLLSPWSADRSLQLLATLPPSSAVTDTVKPSNTSSDSPGQSGHCLTDGFGKSLESQWHQAAWYLPAKEMTTVHS